MSNAQHTPTPWYASLQPDGRFDILDGPNLNTATVLCTRFDYSERKAEMHANAAFIVRACNSHEQLVVALHEIKGWADASLTFGDNGHYRDTVRGILTRASGALAAAEA